MRGHNLMQAIARVNRVFKDKPGGLIVDYLGIADKLKSALKDYTAGDSAKISRQNLVRSRSFTEMLELTIQAYQNRTIKAAQAIAELIELALLMRNAEPRGSALGLSEDELAFYDALEVKDSVELEYERHYLARELTQTVRQNVTIDWTMKESVRAKLRTVVKRLLRQYRFPQGLQEKVTLTVLQQAELLCKDWAA